MFLIEYLLFQFLILLYLCLGILLYGQSDCRNKMIARKIIRKEGIHCIRLDIESIDDRWRGEYKEFSLAIWSLAEIIQPCIIFIDGIGNLIILLINNYLVLVIRKYIQ